MRYVMSLILALALVFATPAFAEFFGDGFSSDGFAEVYDPEDAESLSEWPDEAEDPSDGNPEPSLGMTEARAIELVKAADEKAEKAKEFWVDPQDDGAWVFYSTKYDSKKALFEGGFWYVDETQAVSLGDYSKSVFSWELCESIPPVYASATGSKDKRRVYAAILKNGKPFLIEGMADLTLLGGVSGSLYGYTAELSEESEFRVFLGVNDDELVEIAATDIDEALARRLSGMDDILDELAGSEDGFYKPGEIEVVEYLFRSAIPGQIKNSMGQVQGSVTLNLLYNGEQYHTYVFLDDGGEAHATRGWEEEIAIFEGADPGRFDIGFDVVETVIK